MAGYIGSKAVSLSTTGADIAGDADVSGALDVGGAFTSQGIDDNATSTAMTLDASGNVGIGITPTAKLHLGGTNPNLVFGTSGNELTYLQRYNDDFYIFNKETTGSMLFGTANLERMRIDSAGRVTKPSQPYFAAEINGNSNYVTTAVGTALPFNTVVYNIGSHFNTSTYRFTAPVTGKYLMAVGLIHNQGNPTGRIMFYLNGNADGGNMKWGINGSNSAGGGSHTATAIIYMSANDYVDVRSQSGNINNYQDNHSSWTGMLIG